MVTWYEDFEADVNVNQTTSDSIPRDVGKKIEGDTFLAEVFPKLS
jgi:hypothetical protein